MSFEYLIKPIKKELAHFEFLELKHKTTDEYLQGIKVNKEGAYYILFFYEVMNEAKINFDKTHLDINNLNYD
jgi:hypothetical protein